MTTDWRDLGAAGARALSERRAADAATLFTRVVEARPDHADSWFNLGYARRQARDYLGALEAYARALELGIAGPEAVRVNRALILSDHLDRVEEASHELAQAIAVAPRFVPAWLNLGQLEEDRGRREAAREAYHGALAADPRCARAHARLAALDDDPQAAIASLQSLIARGAMPLADLAELEFALGNMLDSLGNYDPAFDAIDRANGRMAALRPAAMRYDPARHEQLIDALIAGYPTRSAPPEKAEPEVPLFVCGMFRSGSTVAEQLLARHPAITAGGELEFIPAAIEAQLQPYPAAAIGLSPKEIGQLRGEYLAEIARIAPGSPHVTDKRPDNFLHLGLIKSMFPGAAVVHTRRDPRDIAVSTYFLNFAESVRYSERLEDIAHYLGQYRRLMAHWEDLFGPDLVAVDYECLVAEPRAALGPVFARLQLEAPTDLGSQGGGTIRTPSAWAARSPLHGRSVGRWRHYADRLGPVLQELGGD